MTEIHLDQLGNLDADRSSYPCTSLYAGLPDRKHRYFLLQHAFTRFGVEDQELFEHVA